MLSSDIKFINKQLETLYGKSEDGRPFFRLVWSNNETEHRMGTFKYTTESGIFLREETCLSERPKYQYIRDRWILERLVMPVGAFSYEIDIAKGTYECIWNFEKGGKYQKPELWACEYIIKKIMKMMSGQSDHMTESDMAEQNWRDFNKEVEENEMILENESPLIAGQLRDGEAVIVPGNFERVH